MSAMCYVMQIRKTKCTFYSTHRGTVLCKVLCYRNNFIDMTVLNKKCCLHCNMNLCSDIVSNLNEIKWLLSVWLNMRTQRKTHSKKWNCSVINCLTNAGLGILRRPHVYVDIGTCSRELNDTRIARIFKNFHTYVFCKYADIVRAMCNCVF